MGSFVALTKFSFSNQPMNKGGMVTTGHTPFNGVGTVLAPSVTVSLKRSNHNMPTRRTTALYVDGYM